MHASIHSTETVLSLIDLLKIMESGKLSSSANSLRKKGCHPSGPRDFPVFGCLNRYNTMSSVIIIEFRESSVNIEVTSGISDKSSLTKTLPKYEFNGSALLLVVVAVVPSGFFNAGIFTLDLSLEFTYFQKDFGLFLILFAIFRSKLTLRRLVNGHWYGHIVSKVVVFCFLILVLRLSCKGLFSFLQIHAWVYYPS